MYEVKEKSRATIRRNQLQSQIVSLSKKCKDGKRSPKQVEDQNQNLHFVHPVEDFVLESERKGKKCLKRNDKDPRSFASLMSSLWNESPVRNALRVALPLQVLMLLVVGISFMVPNLDEISCFDCLKENNYIREFGPVFYHSFPPPT